MKIVIAIIKPFKLDEVREALVGAGIEGVTASEVRGFGRQDRPKSTVALNMRWTSCQRFDLRSSLPTTRLAQCAKQRPAANTEKIGDGKIFVLPVESAIRIRTVKQTRRSLTRLGKYHVEEID